MYFQDINTYLVQCVDMSKINTTTINLKCFKPRKNRNCYITNLKNKL